MSKRKTTTFDFDGPVEASSFSDVESSADTLMRAEASKDSVFERIRHQPFRAEGHTNWAKVNALVAVLALLVAVVFGLIQAL